MDDCLFLQIEFYWNTAIILTLPFVYSYFGTAIAFYIISQVWKTRPFPIKTKVLLVKKRRMDKERTRQPWGITPRDGVLAGIGLRIFSFTRPG
jgi:hypothetical protein